MTSEVAQNAMELAKKDAHLFRPVAAKANYLAQDRMDIQYATKEVCRGMCAPVKGNIKKHKELQGNTMNL